jgi:hypothetical protein
LDAVVGERHVGAQGLAVEDEHGWWCGVTWGGPRRGEKSCSLVGSAGAGVVEG